MIYEMLNIYFYKNITQPQKLISIVLLVWQGLNLKKTGQLAIFLSNFHIYVYIYR